MNVDVMDSLVDEVNVVSLEQRELQVYQDLMDKLDVQGREELMVSLVNEEHQELQVFEENQDY